MIIFITPFFKFGGADKVHLEIIKSIYNRTRVILLIDFTDSNCVSKDFYIYSRVFILRKKITKKIFTKIIIFLSYIHKLTFFGCNSPYFYSLLPRISKKSIRIDLTHAFSFPDYGIEDLSINYVPFIDTRVVINKKTLYDFKNQYINKGIESSYLKRFIIIPNGLQIQNFNYNLINERFSNFKIGFVSRFSNEKRPEIFLSLALHKFDFDLHVKMIIDTFTFSKSDYPKIEFIEGVNDPNIVRKEFSTISVLIVSSIREGFPLVIMEAMELGIPVISTSVGSISEHIHNYENGFISDNINSEDFIKFCIEKITLMAKDRELYSKMSFSARKYAESNFDILFFQKAYKNLLLNE